MINEMNDRTVEVNARLIMANRAYYGLQNHVKIKDYIQEDQNTPLQNIN